MGEPVGIEPLLRAQRVIIAHLYRGSVQAVWMTRRFAPCG